MKQEVWVYTCRDLQKENIRCVVLAPNSIVGTKINRLNYTKNDKRDVATISKALRNDDYKIVKVPDEEDEDVRDYIRMRDNHRKACKVVKQQIIAFCHRHGFHFMEGKNY